MKQSIFLFCLLVVQIIQAQVFPYNFSVDQGTYTPLTNAVSANNGAVWDDPAVQAPLGFDFQFFDKTASTLYWYGGTAFNLFGVQSDPTPLIISYGSDLIDRGYDNGISQSPISYKTEGTPGNRIFKMEWSNAGFFDDLTGSDFINTQMWLYEGNNKIELHFGPAQVNNPESFYLYTGPLFGFMDSYSFSEDDFDNLWYLVGPVNNPTVKKISGVESFDTLHQTVNGAPGNGLIYRFTPGMVSLDDADQSDMKVRVFPSIVSHLLTLEIPDELAAAEKDMRYEIINQMGGRVKHAPVTSTRMPIDVSGLPSGLYYLSLYSSARIIATQKIVKQ